MGWGEGEGVAAGPDQVPAATDATGRVNARTGRGNAPAYGKPGNEGCQVYREKANKW